MRYLQNQITANEIAGFKLLKSFERSPIKTKTPNPPKNGRTEYKIGITKRRTENAYKLYFGDMRTCEPSKTEAKI